MACLQNYIGGLWEKELINVAACETDYGVQELENPAQALEV